MLKWNTYKEIFDASNRLQIIYTCFFLANSLRVSSALRQHNLEFFFSILPFAEAKFPVCVYKITKTDLHLRYRSRCLEKPLAKMTIRATCDGPSSLFKFASFVLCWQSDITFLLKYNLIGSIHTPRKANQPLLLVSVAACIVYKSKS